MSLFASFLKCEYRQLMRDKGEGEGGAKLRGWLLMATCAECSRLELCERRHDLVLTGG